MLASYESENLLASTSFISNNNAFIGIGDRLHGLRLINVYSSKIIYPYISYSTIDSKKVF